MCSTPNFVTDLNFHDIIQFQVRFSGCRRKFLVHDSLPGHAIFVHGSSMFECMLQRSPHLVACSRFRLLGRFRLRRVPLDANKLKKMGMA